MSTGTSSPSATPKSSNERKQPTRVHSHTTNSKRPQSTQKPHSTLDTGEFWEIKGIIDERRQKGRLQYLVEWKDIDESTGIPYKPTWEPAENITEDAIEDWQSKIEVSPAERDAGLSQLSSLAFEAPTYSTFKRPVHSGDVFQPNVAGVEESAKKRRRARNRYIVLDSQDLNEQSPNHQSDGFSIRPGPSIGYGETGHNLSRVVVELPRITHFDPSEYRQVSLSQSSQAARIVTQGSESQPEEYLCVREKFADHSNRTIPDSQEVSGNSISDTTISGTRPQLELSTESQGRTNVVGSGFSQSGAQVILESSGSVADIPSHQPEHSTASKFINTESVSDFIAESLSYPIGKVVREPLSFYGNSPLPSLRPRFTQVDPGFLTQLPIESEANTSASPTGAIHANDSVSEFSTTSQPSQAVQIVPTSTSLLEVTQSQFRQETDFSVYNDQLDFVPGIIPSQPQESQNSSQALSELDVNSIVSPSVLLSQGAASQVSSERLPLSQHITEKSLGDTGTEEVEVDQSPPISPHPVNLLSQSFGRSKAKPQTPTHTMESTSASSTPLPMSARERLRRIQEENFAQLNLDLNLDSSTTNAPNIPPAAVADASFSDVLQSEQPVDLSLPLISPSLLVPSVEEDHKEAPAIPASGNSLQLNHQLYDGNTTAEASYEAPPEDHPTTLDPSALTLSIENDGIDNEMEGSPSIPTDDGHEPSISEHDDPQASSGSDRAQNYEKGLLHFGKSSPNEYLVTLPLASNIRPQYTEIIRESRNDLRAYNSAFTEEPYHIPEPELTTKVDEMFTRLFDICDLPPFLDALSSITPEGITKHIRGTNSKFAFVGQFLENLRDRKSEKKVLILARPSKIIDLLNNLVETEGYQGIHPSAESVVLHPPTVIVASTSDDLSLLPADFDIVIAYDHTFRQALLSPRDNAIPPIVLALITSTSIQHINMQIPDTFEEPLERKNYLLLALCASIDAMENPELGFAQPHEIAKLFAKFVETPEDDDFYWTPQELPEVIFDAISYSSQVEPMQSSAGANGIVEPTANRKRSLDEADDISAKRARTDQPEVVTTDNLTSIPDSIKGLIGDDLAVDQGKPTVNISVAKAESLAAKIGRLEAELEEARSQREEFRALANRTKQELDSWTSSVNKMQPKYMAALKDRGTFEKDRNIARAEAQARSTQLESSRNEIKALKEANAELKQKLSEATDSLINGTNPDLSKMARLEKELDEASAKLTATEKKFLLVQNDTDYANEQYQIASTAAVQLRKENQDLQSQVVELTRRADDNIVLINQTQSHNEVRELVRLLAEQKSIVRERESELNRVKEQLSSVKNGRRETRQNSVPRSPRLGSLGVMSPRNPGRTTGAVASAGVGTSGAASRGTSPAPLGVFDTTGTPGSNIISGVGSRFVGQQQGNGRFSHLRD